VSQRVNGTDRFFHTDWLGSTRYLSDSTGNNFPSGMRYDGYGSRTSTGGSVAHPTDFQWAGGWGYQKEHADAGDPGIGLTYIQNRYYDSHAGRFMSLDPIRFAGGLNLYEYALGNPVGMVDPDGLSPGDVIDAIAVGISWGEFAANPTAGAFAWATLDTVTALVPGIPGTGIRHIGKIVNLRQAGSAAGGVSTAATQVCRRVPNPYGKLGGPAHQAKVEEVASELSARGLKVQREFIVETVHGKKASRVMDVVGIDPSTDKVVEVYQVGKALKSNPKKPVKRERDAYKDVRRNPVLRGARRRYRTY
jgi:RHS repeat-associated protein